VVGGGRGGAEPFELFVCAIPHTTLRPHAIYFKTTFNVFIFSLYTHAHAPSLHPTPSQHSHFLPQYLEKKVIKVDPFVTIDEEGVGQLVKMTTEKMKAAKQGQDFTAGICGEHGGDPASVTFFSNAGLLDYVSCSPYRVPIAWIAAAQAAIKDGTSKGSVNGNGKAH